MKIELEHLYNHFWVWADAAGLRPDFCTHLSVWPRRKPGIWCRCAWLPGQSQPHEGERSPVKPGGCGLGWCPSVCQNHALWCFSRHGWPRGWPQWRKSFQVYLWFSNLGLIRGLFQDYFIVHNSLSCFWWRVILWWALASVFNMRSPEEIRFKFVVCERHLQECFYFSIL